MQLFSLLIECGKNCNRLFESGDVAVMTFCKSDIDTLSIWLKNSTKAIAKKGFYYFKKSSRINILTEGL